MYTEDVMYPCCYSLIFFMCTEIFEHIVSQEFSLKVRRWPKIGVRKCILVLSVSGEQTSWIAHPHNAHSVAQLKNLVPSCSHCPWSHMQSSLLKYQVVNSVLSMKVIGNDITEYVFCCTPFLIHSRANLGTVHTILRLSLL